MKNALCYGKSEILEIKWLQFVDDANETWVDYGALSKQFGAKHNGRWIVEDGYQYFVFDSEEDLTMFLLRL